MKDYRKQLKEYYGIEFSDDYDIHHIDLNHQNNNIGNLMILPKDIHQEYHRLLMAYIRRPGLNIIPGGCGVSQSNLDMDLIEEMIKIIRKCNKWYDYKLYLDGKIPNIHNITLEV